MTVAILLELTDEKYVEVKPQIYDHKGREKHILRCADNVSVYIRLVTMLKSADETAGYIQIVNKIWCKVKSNNIHEPS